MQTKIKVLLRIVVLVVFYVWATLSYDTVFEWSLNLITIFSGDKIHFVGKLWEFLGKPSFGYLLLAFPILGLLGMNYFKIGWKTGCIKYWVRYFLFTALAYFGTCYFYFLYLSNQIKVGKISFENAHTPMYNVNIYAIAAITIILGTSFQYFGFRFFIYKTK